jgi:hypothetical protein
LSSLSPFRRFDFVGGGLEKQAEIELAETKDKSPEDDPDCRASNPGRPAPKVRDSEAPKERERDEDLREEAHILVAGKGELHDVRHRYGSLARR